MSGIHMSSAAVAPRGQYVVTVGGPGGGSQVGYNASAGVGSISPSDQYRTHTIDFIHSIGGSVNFSIQLDDGALAQNFFTKVRVVDGGGVMREYETASADSFTNGGGFAAWFWGLGGADPVWESGDSGEARVVQFID